MARKAQQKTSRAPQTKKANPAKRVRKELLPTNKRPKLDVPKVVAGSDDLMPTDEGQHALDHARGQVRQPGQIRKPPEPPPSVPPAHTLMPPDADDPLLKDAYDIHTIAVVPNSKIQDKVRRVLSLLTLDKNEERQEHNIADTKKNRPIIVALISRASGTNKCISVGEIAKRELQKDGGQWWQYTGSWSRLETFEPGKDHGNTMENKKSDLQTEVANNLDGRENRPGNGESENGSSEDEDAFELMAVPDRKLVRNVACFVIYLSRQAVPRLKDLYGLVSFPELNLTPLT